MPSVGEILYVGSARLLDRLFSQFSVSASQHISAWIASRTCLIAFAVKFVVRGLPPRCDGVDPRRQHPELVTEGMEIEISAS